MKLPPATRNPYLILDATYYKVRIDGSVRECATLKGIGIPGLVVSDAHAGLKAALRAACNASRWQTCQFNLQQNASHLVTKQDIKSLISSQIAAFFNAEERLRMILESSREKQTQARSLGRGKPPRRHYCVRSARDTPPETESLQRLRNLQQLDQTPHTRCRPFSQQGIIATTRHLRPCQNLRSHGIRKILPETTKLNENTNHSHPLKLVTLKNFTEKICVAEV